MNESEIKIGVTYRGNDGKRRKVHAIVATPKLQCPFFVCYQQGISAPQCISITNFSRWAHADYLIPAPAPMMLTDADLPDSWKELMKR